MGTEMFCLGVDFDLLLIPRADPIIQHRKVPVSGGNYNSQFCSISVFHCSPSGNLFWLSSQPDPIHIYSGVSPTIALALKYRDKGLQLQHR